MTSKQKEALKALAEVMKKHDISFTSSCVEFSRSVGVGRYLVYKNHSVNPIVASDITRFLDEREE